MFWALLIVKNFLHTYFFIKIKVANALLVLSAKMDVCYLFNFFHYFSATLYIPNATSLYQSQDLCPTTLHPRVINVSYENYCIHL